MSGAVVSGVEETVTSAARVRVDELVSFALEQLEGLRLPSGLYCFDRAEREPALRGESVRYSLMALLGYQRARDAGLDVRTDLDALFDTCVERVATFTPGDCGLALWAASRQHDRHVPELVRALEQRISAEHALEPRVGMEIAWMVLGLVAVARSEPSSASARRRVVEHFGARRAPSGLYYHDGSSRFRHRLPNFATQIYSLMALCALARAGLHDRALVDAITLGDHLLATQLANAGWPWLFDAERVRVVERFEVYTVHQDAMAPMAMLELTLLTGDVRYRDAAVRGLAWSRGENALRTDLLDIEGGFAYRSIRRRAPWDRIALGTASGGAMATGRAMKLPEFALEVNRTTRPYHLGWMLEAWAGREMEAGDAGRG